MKNFILSISSIGAIQGLSEFGQSDIIFGLQVIIGLLTIWNATKKSSGMVKVISFLKFIVNILSLKKGGKNVS